MDIEGGADDGALYASMFAEEAGVVVEVADEQQARRILEGHGLTATVLGVVQDLDLDLDLRFNGVAVFGEPVRDLHANWEETGYRLERLQIDPGCADSEWLSHQAQPATSPYRLTFDPDADPLDTPQRNFRRLSAAPAAAPIAAPTAAKPKVAVLREEGTNGDREMAAAFIAAGFEAWDVTMIDLIAGAIDLGPFQMVVFPGGFAFADVLDSGRGGPRSSATTGAWPRSSAASSPGPTPFAGGVQRMPVDGVVGDTRIRSARCVQAALHQERVGAFRVSLQHRPHRVESGGDVAGHGGLSVRCVGGSR